jgi:hypothetical protein
VLDAGCARDHRRRGCGPGDLRVATINHAFGSAFGVRRSVFSKVLRRLIGLSKAHHLGDELVAMYGDVLQRRTPNAERRTAFSSRG